ncbi:MAG: glycosyltransferase family 2 protein [Candidatus Jordarchaeaceae archaeon]
MSAPKDKSRMSVSAIVPIYCEERTVKDVVAKLIESPLIDEVICVDDASDDGSLKILKSFKDRIEIVRHKRRMGKGAALASGVKKAEGDIVCFFDADLLNLSETHIKDLLNPIVNGKAQSVIGYPQVYYEGFASWSGERAYFRKDLLPYLKKMSKAGFGVEIYLNEIFKDKTLLVPLKNLRGYYKSQKFSPDKALKEYIKLVLEVTRVKAKLLGLDSKEIEKTLKLLKSKTVKEVKEKASFISDKRLKNFVKRNILKYYDFFQRQLHFK